MPGRQLQRRRARTGLVLAALTGVAAAGPVAGSLTSSAGAATDSTPGYSVRAISVDVTTGPANDVPCTIQADLYTPDGVDAQHPAPAVLTTNGFGGAKDDAGQRSYAQGFAMAGYVVLTYSGLGFGGSTCKISLDDPAYDGVAGKQLVDVLAGTKQYTDVATGAPATLRTVAQESPGDPRVGMIGVSYGGEVQYAVAEQDPRVDALIPMYTWNDLSYSLAPNNTDFAHGVTYRTPGVHKKIWTTAFFALGIENGFQQFQADPTRIVGCPNFLEAVCVAKAQVEAQGYPDATTLALLRHASVESYAQRITVPTLLVQGQKDSLFNLQESVATYRSLKANGVDTRLVWQSFGHSFGGTPVPGEADRTGTNVPLTATFLGRRFLAWMDHWVRGDSSTPLGPQFSYYRDWVKYDTSPGAAGTAVAKTYASRSAFSDKPTASLYLTGADGLTPRLRSVQAGSASYANAGPAPTSYSETSALEGTTVNQPVRDGQGTFVAFTSRPLAGSFDVVGSPRLTLHLDAPVAVQSQTADPGGKLVLFAKVYDVAPDGTETLKNRLVAPVRVADVTKPVDVTLPGIVHRFAAGHRIRLVVAASDFAYAGNTAPQPVTVTTSPDAPSVIRFPGTSPLTF